MGRNRLPPGFRFHPTDIELVKYYLKRKILGKKFHFEAISEIDIYKFAPSDLPDKSCLRTGDLKWYFFCPRGRKYASGARTNRSTDFGYWKTTGKDRPINYNKEVVGWVRTLIFHVGKAPKGDRTDWVMYEYRLEEKELADKGVEQNAYVLCSIFKKNGPGPKNGAQYGAPFKEEDWVDDDDVEMNETYDGGTSSGVLSGSVKMFPTMQKNSVITTSTRPESMGIKSSVSYPFGNDASAHLSPTVSDASFANMEIPLVLAKDNNVDADLVPQVVLENNDVVVLTPQVADDDNDFDALLRAFLDKGPSTPIGNGESSIILNGNENNPHTPGGNYKTEVSNKDGSFEAPVQSDGDDFYNGLGDLDILNGVAGYSEGLNMMNHDEVDKYLSLDDIARPLDFSTEANGGGGDGDVQNGGFNVQNGGFNGDSSFYYTPNDLQDTVDGFNSDELLACLRHSSELPNKPYGFGNQLNLFDIGVHENTNRNNNVGWEREATTPFNSNTSAPP